MAGEDRIERRREDERRAGSFKKSRVRGRRKTKEVVEGRWGRVEKAETNCRLV